MSRRPRGDVAEILFILGTKNPKKVTLVPQPGMTIPWMALHADKRVACIEPSYQKLRKLGAKLRPSV